MRAAAAAILTFALLYATQVVAQVDHLRDQSEATTKQREQILKTLIEEQVFTTYQADGGVQVGQQFYLLSAKDRERYTRIAASAFWGKTNEHIRFGIALYDGATGKPIGEYSRRHGLSLNLPPDFVRLLPMDFKIHVEDTKLRAAGGMDAFYFEKGVLKKYDDRYDPDEATLSVGPAFWRPTDDNCYRNLVIRSVAYAYGVIPEHGGRIIIRDYDDGKVPFAIFTPKHGLIMRMPLGPENAALRRKLQAIGVGTVEPVHVKDDECKAKFKAKLNEAIRQGKRFQDIK